MIIVTTETKSGFIDLLLSKEGHLINQVSMKKKLNASASFDKSFEEISFENSRCLAHLL
jgi:hypothetical protein